MELCTEAQQTLLKSLLDIPQKNPSVSELQALLTQACDQYAASASGPVDLHTLAVLKHKLADIASSEITVEDADAAYQAACQAYTNSGFQNTPIERLCLLDLGWLYAEHMDAKQQNNYQDMLGFFPSDVKDVKDPFVRAHILTLKGIAVFQKEKYSDADHYLQDALDLLKSMPLYDLDHPLVAHVNERMAWSAIYQWKVDSACEHFKDALGIRESTDRKFGDPLQAVYALHNKHGQAMAERFQGESDVSRQDYEGVLKKVGSLLDDLPNATGQINRHLIETKCKQRQSNTAERRADCELYQGAASNVALVDLSVACKNYELASKEDAVEDATRIAMKLKLAIALALNGRLKEAGKVLGDAESELQTTDNIESEKARIDLLLPIAKAVLAFKSEGGIASGQEKLREILRRMRIDKNVNAHTIRAEILELYLFCAEMLVASEMDAPPPDAGAQSVEHLWYLLSLLPEDELRPYLRRYCEIGVEATIGRDVEMAWAFVQKMRDLTVDDNAVHVVFFLPKFFVKEPQGVAIVVVGQELKPIELTFDRKEVLQGERDDAPFSLREELVQRIADLRRDGREVRIEWSDDGVCWPKGSEDALTDANEPEAVRKLRGESQ